MSDTPNIRSIRAKARDILKAAGVDYAKSYPTMVRGWRTWSRGVTIDEYWLRDAGLAQVVPRYDIHDVRERDLARSVEALRAQVRALVENGVSIHKAVARERAAVVRWLRQEANRRESWDGEANRYRMVASAIENGDHHDEEDPDHG